MPSTHIFKATLNWKSNLDGNPIKNKRLSRNHKVNIEGKEALKISAAKVFKGDENLHNPEDLLLSALTSCHLMSYLYVCAQNQIEIVEYSDNSTGTLEVEGSGKGSFTSVNLAPKVTIKNEENINLAKELHSKAHELCFIANSCSFPIHLNPHISATN